MSNAEKEAAVSSYFNMWVRRDFSLLEQIFAPDIYYSECYGPEYRGLSEIRLWVAAMLQRQKVLEWNIKRFVHENNTVVAEWFFRDECDHAEHFFDGVSIIEFQADGKIASVKEFESKSQHITPYRANELTGKIE